MWWDSNVNAWWIFVSTKANMCNSQHMGYKVKNRKANNNKLWTNTVVWSN